MSKYPPQQSGPVRSGSSESRGAHPGRRRLLTTAAWSAPTVMVSTTAPALAASKDPKPTVDFGLFAQVHNTKQESRNFTMFGVSAFPEAETRDTRGTQGWDEVNGVTATSGLVSRGAGTFTPGGSLGRRKDDVYGGAGLWISVPKFEGAFVAGESILTSGAVIDAEFVSVASNGKAGFAPLDWAEGTQRNRVALSNTGNSSRASLNGAAYTFVWGPATVTGSEWRGTATITTTQDLVASGPTTRYNQILFSSAWVYYDVLGPRDFSVTYTIRHGQVNVRTSKGMTSMIDLAGRTVTSRLTL